MCTNLISSVGSTKEDVIYCHSIHPLPLLHSHHLHPPSFLPTPLFPVIISLSPLTSLSLLRSPPPPPTHTPCYPPSAFYSIQLYEQSSDKCNRHCTCSIFMRTTSSLFGLVPTNLACVTASDRFSTPIPALGCPGSIQNSTVSSLSTPYNVHVYTVRRVYTIR